MASSRNSATVDNLKFEAVKCGCGRRASIEVSKSVKNPGRLYYGCATHGWVKWVSQTSPNDEVKFDNMVRRNGFDEFAETSNSLASRSTGNMGTGIGIDILRTLVAVNLVLLAAYLFAQLIHLLKN